MGGARVTVMDGLTKEPVKLPVPVTVSCAVPTLVTVAFPDSW